MYRRQAFEPLEDVVRRAFTMIVDNNTILNAYLSGRAEKL